MHGYNTTKAHVYYPRHIYMVEPRVYYKLLVERTYKVTGANYYPDYHPWYIYMVEGT